MEAKANELSEIHVFSVVYLIFLGDWAVIVHRRIELVEVAHFLIVFLQDVLDLRLPEKLSYFVSLLSLFLHVTLVHLHDLVFSVGSDLLLLSDSLLLCIHFHLVFHSATGLGGLELVLEFVFLVFEELLASLFLFM